MPSGQWSYGARPRRCAAAYGIALAAGNASIMASTRTPPRIRVQVLAPAGRLPQFVLGSGAHAYSLAEHRGEIAGSDCESAPRWAHAIRAGDIAANKAMGNWGLRFFPNGADVLTHCNAGALATAGHGTALGVVRSRGRGRQADRVIADETRPFLQGAR